MKCEHCGTELKADGIYEVSGSMHGDVRCREALKAQLAATVAAIVEMLRRKAAKQYYSSITAEHIRYADHIRYAGAVLLAEADAIERGDYKKGGS